MHIDMNKKLLKCIIPMAINVSGKINRVNDYFILKKYSDFLGIKVLDSLSARHIRMGVLYYKIGQDDD